MNRLTKGALIAAAVSAGIFGLWRYSSKKAAHPPATEASSSPAKIPNLAPDTTVFGVVRMGMPLGLPKCSGNHDENPCLGGPAPGGMEWEVHIPALGESYQYSAVVGIREMDGAVHSASVRSKENYSAPDDVLADLVEKYGRPTTTIESDNFASWDFDDLHVTWSGPTPDSRHATVFIRTPAGQRAFMADYELKNTRIPKL